ncbi:SoxY-related AACIE arm protein [Telmatospirillum siberiense]|uniref:SoxY-related AACIE arm protein n=1 Tax=Telmatospirillum siberiense TaxID=382514 RepID=A0A2N3PPV4_9PROT|nr:SoxY-related AACIE arm protein [Telmatospirillum siberiense]PKU22431.1 SoxY-related AACIE arm protein [Telmatospirillum siberiense]
MSSPISPPCAVERRRFLRQTAECAAGAAVTLLLAIRPARATPEEMRAAIRQTIGPAAPHDGRVLLDLPPLVENGNAVPLTVTVDSPMTGQDHVVAIHLFNEKNPQPYVASFHLGPRAGRAQVSTRIKLADSQQVIAIAQMSDGSFWQGGAKVIVTIAACVEDVN